MSNQVVIIGKFKEKWALLEALQQSHVLLLSKSATEAYSVIESTLKKQCVSVILDLCIEEDDEDGFMVLETLRKKFPMVEVIVLAPTLAIHWQIEVLRLGAFCFETYDVEHAMIVSYLAKIESQFDLFKIAEKTCRNHMIQHMALRINLALEFMIKRRFEGQQLSKEDLAVFFPFGTSHLEQGVALEKTLQQLISLENNAIPIFILEDEARIIKMLENSLGKRLNYNLTIAMSLQEARETLDATPPFSVALLDIGLGDGWGTELIQPILEKSALTEIIMLTAFHEKALVQESFRLGASHYIPKPFDPDYLQQVIGLAVQRHAFKSFLPSEAWRPLSVLQATLEHRMRLFQEVISHRIQSGKLIQTHEIGLFFPSFSVDHLSQTEWIDPKKIHNRVVPFLMEYSQKHQIVLGSEEVRWLDSKA